VGFGAYDGRTDAPNVLSCVWRRDRGGRCDGSASMSQCPPLYSSCAMTFDVWRMYRTSRPELKWIDSVRQRARPKRLVRNPSTYATCVSSSVCRPYGERATISIVPQAVMRVRLLPALTERRSGLSLVLFQPCHASVLITCVLDPGSTIHQLSSSVWLVSSIASTVRAPVVSVPLSIVMTSSRSSR
jgi:hypothetical protein